MSVQKTELVLIITPRVINNSEDGDRISREIKERALTLKPGITEYGRRVGEEKPP